MQTLSVTHFPLSGQALIEASAGTGKTFTITGLYNRLILGHGREADGEAGHARLGCDQILVVTFTRAATEELRGRIRQRLRTTLEDLLRLENAQAVQDPDLEFYLQALAQQQNTTQAALRAQLLPWLQSNLALMDEAAIFTIHGFCQRMLKQFAFDSGVVFNAELVLDSDTYLQQACEDIWRQQAYHLNTAQSRYLVSRYAGPDDLLNKIKSRLARPDVRVLPAVDEQDFTALWQQAVSHFQTLKTLCQQSDTADVAQRIQDSGLDKRSYSKKNAPNWVEQTFRYCQGEFYLPAPDNLARLTPALMSEKLKAGELPQHPLFPALESFLAVADQLSLMLELGWMEAIKNRYFELLEKAGALTPDDLLRLLVTALKAGQGDHLAAQIRRLYPLAMIDEFQDTDPQQYDIFNRIYPPGMARQDVAIQPDQNSTDGTSDNVSADYGLIMIGDPKQAIYGFRGADIFTYIQARRQLSEEQRFTLNTNWRSQTKLVDGVNQLFAAHDSPFVYDRDIEFIQVKAAGKHDDGRLTVGGEQQVPLQLWYDGEEYSRAGAQQTAAAQCAQQIAALLQGAGQLAGEPVQARDIAVLVRSRRQAGWIREALSALGIGSVFLTRDSVYDTQEARDLFSWLQAVAHPADERALRSAMASETQGLTAQQLDELLNQESVWESALERNFAYHQLWNRRGVMAAIMQWLEDDGRAEQLRAMADGERRLTNLMHLGELLQAASRRLRGHEALLRWFGEHIFAQQRSGDEAQLRLESDANLVTIVTIHKSKGLEYPLVFLPYLWDDSYQLNARSDVQYFSETMNSMVLDLAPDSEARAAATRDSLAESLRLLYVALTRAVQGCFIWLMDAVDGRSRKEKKSLIATSALGYLLQLEADADWQGLLQRSNDALLIGALPDWQPSERAAPMSGGADQVQAALASGRAYDSWRVSSYSQLTAEHGGGDDHILVLDETEAEPALLAVTSTAPLLTQAFDELAPALQFAKGANAGTCLHAIFEHWDFADQRALADITRRELAHYGLLDQEREEQQVTDIAAWMTAVVNSPLMNDHGETFSLSAVAPAQRLDEMEFYLPIAGLQAARIDQLLAAGSDGRRRFSFDPLSGYLKGFIDLIFCHNGRYYVADYKSNHLGFTLADYTPRSLAQAMTDHRYDLQAWIYTLALDQLLANRLADYSPEQHLGGVFYFYLRGMHLGPGAPCLPLTQTAAAPSTEVIQGDLFAPPAAAGSDDICLPPGVYYHPVDGAVLARWRQAVLPAEQQPESGA